MIVNVRPRTLRTRVWLFSMAFGAVLMGVTMPAAKADTVAEYADKNAAEICLMLDHNPGIAGVDYVSGELLRHKPPPEAAAAVLLMSVNDVCPWYLPEVFAWANRTAPNSVGGAYVA